MGGGGAGEAEAARLERSPGWRAICGFYAKGVTDLGDERAATLFACERTGWTRRYHPTSDSVRPAPLMLEGLGELKMEPLRAIATLLVIFIWPIQQLICSPPAKKHKNNQIYDNYR